MWARVVACETEWRAVIRNIAEDLVSDCARFIVASCFLHLVLHFFFSTVVGILASGKRGGTTDYLIMDFTVL